jgi:hypothetical protein
MATPQNLAKTLTSAGLPYWIGCILGSPSRPSQQGEIPIEKSAKSGKGRKVSGLQSLASKTL